MITIYVVSLCLLLSWFKDKEKTKKAIQKALKKMKKIAYPFLEMIGIVSFILALIPQNYYEKVFQVDHPYISIFSALGIGSISAMPGFVAFPLAKELLAKGAPFFVLSAFTSALMMVGLATFSLEAKFLGIKSALMRNVSSLLIAFIVAICTGFAYGELL